MGHEPERGSFDGTMTKDEIEKELQTELDEFWLPLLKTKGRWDERKIKNELHDLVFVYKQVAEVYCYITGNMLSKPMYYADTIKTAFDDAVEQALQYRLEDEREESH
jgi:hypothetical protein